MKIQREYCYYVVYTAQNIGIIIIIRYEVLFKLKIQQPHPDNRLGILFFIFLNRLAVCMHKLGGGVYNLRIEGDIQYRNTQEFSLGYHICIIYIYCSINITDI